MYCISSGNAASSVDAERAFSDGRLQVNHLQHNMSGQTFKAQVALGSWSKTPLMPGLKMATDIIELQMQGKWGRGKPDKGKEKANAIVVNNSDSD
jgi:hypothetical protein